MWAKMDELARCRLERKVEEEKARNKAEIDSLRRDMVARKDQAEKMNTTWGEAILERRLFQVKAHRLERVAFALGDEVQMAQKKGKTLSTAEQKGIQKLLKKTAKTAKSACLWDAPEETPAPPPEAPPPPPPLPPPPSEQMGQASEPPQLPPGT